MKIQIQKIEIMKQNYLKRTVRILLLSLLFVPIKALAVDSEYLNVHEQMITQSILLDDVDKITFGEDAVNVALADKTLFSVLYSDFRKFTFGEKAQSTAVETVQGGLESSLTISYQVTDCTVIIDSAFPIEGVAVYNIQGRLMHQSTPRVETLTVSLTDYPSGIYIINVNNGETITTEKISNNKHKDKD